MSSIHYFQRYSSRENTVTNNTLQLFARIYAYAPRKASQFLNLLISQDEDIEVGIEIKQQTGGRGSVPDGSIIQRSFKILIESKVDSAVSVPQLLKHAMGFHNEQHKVLLLLTKAPVNLPTEHKIRSALAKKDPSIIFQNVTYEQLYTSIDGLFQEYEYEMVDLLEDYKEYCRETGLVDQSRFMLRIVPCGKSLNINLKFGIYFHPDDRGYSDHQYVGVYKEKTVQALWSIESVFDVEFDGHQLKKVLVHGRDTDAYDQKIVDIIGEAWTECGYKIASGHRFFCGDPQPTKFIKESPGGLMGNRLINLKDLLGDFEGAADAAAKLSGMRWR